MYVHSPQEGGQLYGFCPGKAQWDPQTVSLYNLLVVVAETGQLLEPGGINNQPDWFIDLIAWFLPQYSTNRFLKNAELAFTGGGTPKAGTTGSQPLGQTTSKGRATL